MTSIVEQCHPVQGDSCNSPTMTACEHAGADGQPALWAGDDPESSWMDDEDWAAWCEACHAGDGHDEVDRWAWLEDYRRATEAIEQAEHNARLMRAGGGPGHPFGPDFDLMLWSSEGH